MNLRPLGYEPNELPGCSTPRTNSNIVTPNFQWQIVGVWSRLRGAYQGAMKMASL